MNLLFSGNDYVFDGIMTCLLSIFMRTESREPFTAYVLTMDVSHLKPAYVPISDDAAVEHFYCYCRRSDEKRYLAWFQALERRFL